MMSLPTSITVEGVFYQSQQRYITQGQYELFILAASLQQNMSWPDSVALTKVCITLGPESIFGFCVLLYGAVLIRSMRSRIQYFRTDQVELKGFLSFLAPVGQSPCACLCCVCDLCSFIYPSFPLAYNLPKSAMAVRSLGSYLAN